MKVAINGIGIAGPTLAWWLKKLGHEPVLFERAPKLRTGGYVVDFWGIGYDVAEMMGILPTIKKKGYRVNELRILNESGKTVASMDPGVISRQINDRFATVARSDISAAIHEACVDVESRFGLHITGIDENKDAVTTTLSDGSRETFDLVVGADGLHSHIRSLAFGDQSTFEKPLGCHVIAIEVLGYKPRNESSYFMHSSIKRQVARLSMRDDKTLFLFIFRSGLIEKQPESDEDKIAILQKIFGSMKGEVPHILEQINHSEGIYFDSVSQIRMKSWTKGRVALIGDAAACVSLLAGEGTGLAMTEAYVLANELHLAAGDYEKAFRNYEDKLMPFLIKKQKAALGFASFFAPKNRFSYTLRNVAINLSNLPLLTNLIAGRAMRDDFELPRYESPLS